MDVAPLGRGDLADWGDLGGDLDTNTPLWPYILREAELVADGEHLGPVGGRIVAEVFVGPARGRPRQLPQRRPVLDPDAAHPWTTPDDFGMADLLTVAGVDPQSRGQ